uniref:S-locus glycoprotein domain-containing protein n=1 Tax=Populus trichocarpa TaxID=3694 RepID=A0A3N7FSV6_POPTR
MNLPETYDAAPEAYANYSYWPGPDILNVTGDVVAVLDEAGSFGIVYGESSNGAVYVYKNDGDYNGLGLASSQSSTRLSILRRLILKTNGNLRLYRWDNDVNGSRQWVPEWAAVSNPYEIAGICGNGVCNLDRSKTIASCSCLPGTSKAGGDNFCSENSLSIGRCDSRNANQTSEFKIAAVQQTNYYFSDFSVIANYNDIPTVSKCGDACLSDCECVASVYGLDDENPYCWILRSLDFGGYEDPGSTLFVKVRANESMTLGGNKSGSDNGDTKRKVLVVPIVLNMTFLVVLLCLLLYHNVHKKRSLKRVWKALLFFLALQYILLTETCKFVPVIFHSYSEQEDLGVYTKEALEMELWLL